MPEVIMSSPAVFISVVDSDHTVKAPPDVAIGAKVLVVPMPSMMELLQDTARRARFAATHRAVREAISTHSHTPSLTDEAVVNLVRRARQTHHNH